MISNKQENMQQKIKQRCQLNLAIIVGKKPNDVQINYFLDFLQHDGVMQDVVSGTFSAKLSSSRKTSTPNAIKMVPKAEVIRLYISACNKQGYTQKAGHP